MLSCVLVSGGQLSGEVEEVRGEPTRGRVACSVPNRNNEISGEGCQLSGNNSPGGILFCRNNKLDVFILLARWAGAATMKTQFLVKFYFL